ncbi:MAG TPA: response regulator transcription factor [Thermoclostridium caenicola]|uniref:response regulator transcription factor n=1 Tax=Thermoclostridium caenicola TaxID=659425 RepID=UPI002C653FA4|nr:response regulator transcription factor [Thermoclostridium caenicola]HOK42754.1 response regulator transcription factor [Thermoclostridium caenicola]HOL83992.1 response regulator transcription factor [Thermoclostridium caenicola]HPO76021.1 response regulator transcription factor [Thermoclostridium caenicola]
MIYYVEDDENIRELVVYTLSQVGLPAVGFPDATAFWSAMEEQLPELILLDIMLPREDGLAILKRLRSDERSSEIPVIMITARGSEFDKVLGLDLGADDYIAKPFGMAELVARIKARLRRKPGKPDEEKLSVGTLVLDKKAHRVTVEGAEVSLTLKEYELLRILMENRGMVLTRDQLLERVWDYSYDGSSRTVDVHIQTLRTKLGHCADMIETVRGVGYRFGGRNHD